MNIKCKTDAYYSKIKKLYRLTEQKSNS